MTKKIAFHIFLWGTVSSAALFLFLTWDTHVQVVALSNVDRLSDQVVAGKREFEKYNCNDCHTILGFGGYYAPDLTKVVRRIGAEGVRYRVMHPAKAFENSWRKMPRTGIKEPQVIDLIAFFRWVGNIDNSDWPPQDSLTRAKLRMIASSEISPGAAIFMSSGCMNCHSLSEDGGRKFGPALNTVGRKLSREEIENYIRNPKSRNPQAMMPPQTKLTEMELKQVSEFLSGLK